MSVHITEHADGQLSIAFDLSPTGKMSAQRVADTLLDMMDDNRRVILALVRVHNQQVSK